MPARREKGEEHNEHELRGQIEEGGWGKGGGRRGKRAR